MNEEEYTETKILIGAKFKFILHSKLFTFKFVIKKNVESICEQLNQSIFIYISFGAKSLPSF